MKLFKNYKKLYKIEKNNNKLLNQRNQELYAYKIQAQKDYKELKKDRSTLFVQVEDLQYELKQVKEENERLQKELSNVKRIKTRFQNKLKKLEGGEEE